MQAFSETYPPRYRDMLEAYFKNVSKAETTARRNHQP
jgi:hypothetical protein